MLNFCFLTQKAYPCAESCRLAYCISIRGPRLWGVRRTQKRSRVNIFLCAISRILGKETPLGIVTKFCMWVDIQDVITCATFGDDRLRCLGVAMGRISHFPIDLRRRPYNTLALLYECAIYLCAKFGHSKSNAVTVHKACEPPMPSPLRIQAGHLLHVT